MVLRVCVHISGKKAYLCTIRILPESSTFAGYNNTQHEHELGVFRDPWTAKRFAYQKKNEIFAFPELIIYLLIYHRNTPIEQSTIIFVIVLWPKLYSSNCACARLLGNQGERHGPGNA